MARPSSSGSRIGIIKWNANANHGRSDRRRSDSSKSGRSSRSSSRATAREEDNIPKDSHHGAKACKEQSDAIDKHDSASIITFSAPAKVTLSIRRFKRVRWCSRVENIAPPRFSLPPSEVDVSQTSPGARVYEIKLPKWWCRFYDSMCCVRAPREEEFELPAGPLPQKRPHSPPISPGSPSETNASLDLPRETNYHP